MITVNGRNVNLYNSMFDYVNDADFSHYEISDGKERETTFIEANRRYDEMIDELVSKYKTDVEEEE
jgi:hypothetical protein